MKSRVKWILSAVLVLCVLFVGSLFFNHDIGVPKSRLEEDIRSSQYIDSTWTVTGEASDEIAAYVSYPEDRSSATFSIYVNYPGLSFGYFFRAGGSLNNLYTSILSYTVSGTNQRAFISMNEQHAARLKINDGNGGQVMELDSNKPFAFVLPQNMDVVAFYDTEGNVVEFYEQKI